MVNNDKKKLYMQKFLETHDIHIKQICEICGGIYTYKNKSNHLKTKKHTQTIKNNEKDNEIEKYKKEIELLKIKNDDKI
jgi:hypothetical protein